ncbi:MAG: alpha/beta hydrolase [Pseudomonadota bacterium]
MQHDFLRTGGIELHIAWLGNGPLVVLCHGFPGLWYSWRHQLPALAAAGYRAVALDMRGYGRSSRPAELQAYGLDRTAQDVLAVLDHFGEQRAVLVGHDFGANLAWHMAVHTPERLRGVVSLCVPYAMPLAGNSEAPPSELFASIASKHFFHMHYYQQSSVPESATIGREREFLRKLFWALCADGELLRWEDYPSEGTSYIDVLSEPPHEPPWSWLSVGDFEYYLNEYLCEDSSLTFAGGINSYRVMDHNWRMFRSSRGADVVVPSLFVGGEKDPVVKLGSDADFDVMRRRVRDLRGLTLVAGAGHFVQQEQPDQTTNLLLNFLASLTIS